MAQMKLTGWLGKVRTNDTALAKAKRHQGVQEQQQRRLDAQHRQQKELEAAHRQEIAAAYRPEYTWEQNGQLEAALDSLQEGLEWHGQLVREDLLDDEDLAIAHAWWDSRFERRLTAYMNEVLREKPEEPLPEGSLAAAWYAAPPEAAPSEAATPET